VRIIVAPDKFKSCLTAAEVASAISAGLPDWAEIECIPLADGGEGTLDALVAATNGQIHHRRVTGPLPEMKIDAPWGLLGDGQTAVVEMSAASGLHLLAPVQYDPLATTTFGTGELLMAAARHGVSRILLGIGGSATVDGGIGAAHACGLPVLLRDGEPTSPTEPLCGRDLEKVLMIKHGRGSAIERVKIDVMCDVNNPLFGDAGAARVFGPQKGASPELVEWLDDQLRALAIRTGRIDEAKTPGAGAAGGLGFAMLAFFGATLRPGFDTIAQTLHLRDRIAGADLVITGEGRFDASSLHGKTAMGVARLCRELGVRCVVIAGSVEESAAKAGGVTDVVRISPPDMAVEESMRRARELLVDAARSLNLKP
jgi:glycerate kinase